MISLNTNSATTVGEYERIAAAAGDGHVLVIINAYGDREWIPVANQAASDYVRKLPPIRFWSTGTVLSRHTPIGSDRTASTRRPDKAKTCMPPV